MRGTDADGRGSGDNDDNRNRRQSKGSFFPLLRSLPLQPPKECGCGAFLPLLPPLSFLARFTLKECITNDDDRAERVGQAV